MNTFYINEFILNGRLEQKLTQVQLAKKAKVTQGYLSKIETNKLDPNIMEAIRLVNALGYDILFKKRNENE